MTYHPSIAHQPVGRLAERPISNKYGQRPMKRAKRTYKSKGVPLAVTQARTARQAAEHSQQSRTAKRSTVLTATKHQKLSRFNEFERMQVLRVLLAGATAQQVANELHIDVNYCTRLLKAVENDIKTLGIEEFKSLLWQKVSGIMDDHGTIAGSIGLLLIQVDMDLKRISGRLDGLLARIAEHQTDQPPNGEAYNVARTQWQAIGRGLEAEQGALQATRQGLRTEKIVLQREKRANNKDFVDMINKMGVTTSPPVDNNKVPPQVPASYEITGGVYEGMLEGDALLGLERGVEDMRKYLREQRKLKQVVDLGIPGSSEKL